jgi:hypothetical protein
MQSAFRGTWKLYYSSFETVVCLNNKSLKIQLLSQETTLPFIYKYQLDFAV